MMWRQARYPPKQICFFWRYIAHHSWGQNVTPDLLASIIEPTDPVREELRRILMKMHQFIRKKIIMIIIRFAHLG